MQMDYIRWHKCTIFNRIYAIFGWISINQPVSDGIAYRFSTAVDVEFL